MADIKLSDKMLADAAGWREMKRARELYAAGGVVEAKWEPPLLQGEVREGTQSFRTGLKIHGPGHMDNLCRCRESQRSGIICGHAVAVGLQAIHGLPLPTNEPRRLERNPEPILDTPETVTTPATWLDADAPAALLHLIFPPNLDRALAQGKAMLTLHAEIQGKRAPLDRLPRRAKCCFPEEDRPLLTVFHELARGEVPAVLMLQAAQLVQVLEVARGHERITLGGGPSVQVFPEPDRPHIFVDALDEGGLRVTWDRETVPGAVLWAETGAWRFHENRFIQLGFPAGWCDLVDLPRDVPANQVPLFLAQALPEFESCCVVEQDLAGREIEVKQVPADFRLELQGGLAQLRARILVVYDDHAIVLSSRNTPPTPWIARPEHPFQFFLRDIAGEQNAEGRLVGRGFSKADAEGWRELRGQDQVLPFFATEYPRLRREWDVRVEERLRGSLRKNTQPVEAVCHYIHSGQDWFEFEMQYQTREGAGLDTAEIQRLIRGGQSYSKRPDGRFLLVDTEMLEEFDEVLRDTQPTQGRGRYKVGQAQNHFLADSLESLGIRETGTIPAEQDVKVAPLELGPMEEVLRPYQKAGVQWMHLLRARNFGGVLADEMGLGKTLQTLCYLSRVVVPGAHRGGQHCPALVVCPTSLVFNWQAEAEKFTPHLKVLALHGPDRKSLFDEIPAHDLVLTSYALIRRDAEEHARFRYDTIILDEAQHIKNRESQNAKAVKRVPAERRLVLTGTPLENAVLDLWSLFDFLMPGYLGDAKDFKERYEMPIARDRDRAVQSRLARRVRPFLLRRTKVEVAPELPERLEQVSYCDLTPRQAAVYREILEAGRREVQNVGRGKEAQARMRVFQTLLRLRQASCDLRLLDLPDLKEADCSGKLDMLSELLDEAVDGGHRVLVFSQFVGMLTLIRERLESGGMAYCYLDGSTRDRAAVVQRFQSQADIPVFLISLKAGGTGLNLTAADMVVHFDPWWNPAVEAQATDRAHRIGQQRKVTSYKLVARGTVEEKIIKLQARKKEMFEGLISGEGGENLSWEEIQSLLD